MQKPLISGGKLVTNGANIVFDVPNAHVITGKTKEAIRKIIRAAEAENEDDIIMTVPFDHNTLTWQINQAKTIPVPEHVANNVHRIRSKEVLVDFLHRAAGYPTKKTWLQAIRWGFYATWPGLTYELVSKFLPDDTEETAAGHLHRNRQGI